MGAVLVVRRAAKDELLFVSRSADQSKTVVSSLKTQAGGADCRFGMSNARVSANGNSWVVSSYIANGGLPTIGTFQIYKTTVDALGKATAVDATPQPISALIAATTDSTADGPANGLDFRGLTNLDVRDGVLTLVIEIYDGPSKQRRLLLYSFAL